ncbi:MAG: collagen-like protein [Alphaproteobacteria bacterium]|nr:collagen-like protein [Alphaproteobacteria bacterium]
MKHSLVSTATIGALLVLGACESTTTRRIASVGSTANGLVGPAGPQGEAGPKGETGLTGPQGIAGLNGADGLDGISGDDGNFNLGEAGMIATGGLVGDNGIGGTGLLANLGDPNTSAPALDTVSLAAGDLLSGTGEQLASVMTDASSDSALSNVVVAAADTVTNLGDTLTGYASGEEMLVDGVLDATSPLLAANIGASNIVGGDETSALGLSVLSDTQAEGTLLEAGLANDDMLLNLDLAPNTDGGLEVPGVATVDVIGGEGDLLNTNLLSDTQNTVEDVITAATNPEFTETLLTETTSGLEDTAGSLIETVSASDTGGSLLEDTTESLTGTVEDLLDAEETGGLLEGLTGSDEDGDVGGLGGLLSGIGGGGGS